MNRNIQKTLQTSLKKTKKIVYYCIVLLVLFLSYAIYSNTQNRSIQSHILFPQEIIEVDHIKLHNSETKKLLIPTEGDFVILIHGIASGSWYMKKIAEELQKQGFVIINIDYPSRTVSIEELTNAIYDEIILKIAELEMNFPKHLKNKNIHFVGHSMGALLIRSLLNTYTFDNLGKVVQLAPPNHGSEIVDFFYNFPLFKFFYGPAGQQLNTKNTKLASQLGEVKYELGIIAGTNTLAPFSSFFLLEGDDDGRVRVESTKLKGMKEHILLPVSHTTITFNGKVIEKTIQFIRTSSFQEEYKGMKNDN